MQRDDSLAFAPYAPDQAAVHMSAPGILYQKRGWTARDWHEAQIARALHDFGPLASAQGLGLGLSRYLVFPWSSYIETLKQPDLLEAPLLRNALRHWALKIAPGSKVISSCSHPDMLDYLPQLAKAGVSDLFWTGLVPADYRPPPGLRLHPLAALPPQDAPAPAPQGPDIEGKGAGFLFCRAQAGGNSARLWQAISAGLIPVLPRPAGGGLNLPGPASLWHEAIVLYDGPDLPDETLNAIAAEPARAAKMRAALAQLALAYGPARQGCYDIILCLLAEQEGVLAQLSPARSRFAALVEQCELSPPDEAPLDPALAERLMRAAKEELDLGSLGLLPLPPRRKTLAAWRLAQQAYNALPPSHSAALAFAKHLAQQRAPHQLDEQPLSPVPATHSPKPRLSLRKRPIRLYICAHQGPHTPLSSPALQPYFGQALCFVDRPEEADFAVLGNPRDCAADSSALAQLCAPRKGLRALALSQIPYWDGADLQEPRPKIAARRRSYGQKLKYYSLNQLNCDIFTHHYLPWAITQRDEFPARYAMLIAGFAALSPKALLAHWRGTPLQAAFFAAQQTGPEFSASFPEQGLYALSDYRSHVASLTASLLPPERILRQGAGLGDHRGQARHQQPDWHLDKLAQLHGKVRLCSAYESCLLPGYVSEKPFDAFAVGAIAVGVADHDHRLLDLIVPEAMMNTVHASAPLAAARIARARPDLILAEAWRESAHHLLGLLRHRNILHQERHQIAERCLSELRQLL